MMNKRTLAKLTGWSLILMAAIAAFALGYAYPEFYTTENQDDVNQHLTQNIGLYGSMLAGILGIIVLDVVVSITLYRYFKGDHQKISWTAAALRLVYTALFVVAFCFLVINLNSLSSNNDVLIENFEMFQSIWNAGLVIFGGHLLLVGYLMKLHKPLPNLLAYTAMLAGISYIVIHALKFANMPSDFIGYLEMALMLPMVVGELGLAIWLIVRGGKREVV